MSSLHGSLSLTSGQQHQHSEKLTTASFMNHRGDSHYRRRYQGDPQAEPSECDALPSRARTMVLEWLIQIQIDSNSSYSYEMIGS